MKTKLLYLLTTIFLIYSCSKEESILTPDPDKPIVTEPAEEKRYLSIEAEIEHRKEARGAVDIWIEGMQMNVFSSQQSALYTILNGKWDSEKPIELGDDSETKITAVFPYNKDNTINKVDIDVSEQQDIMYANSTLNKDESNLKMTMKHAMALLRFKLNRNTYNQGDGQVNSLVLNNIYKYAILEPSLGIMQVKGEKTNYTLGGNFNVSEDIVSEAIVIPSANSNGVTITMNLDGEDYYYELPSDMRWEEGYMYTYTLNLKKGTNIEVFPDDYTVDVDYWADYGKHETLVFRDYGNDIMQIAPSYTEHGYEKYTGEGNIFGAAFYYYNFTNDSDFKGYYKFLLKKGNEIVEQYPEFPFTCRNGGFICKSSNCFITAVPGTYQLVPIFRKEGESKWFNFQDYDKYTGNNAQEWEYEIKSKTDLPALRMVNLEGEQFLDFRIFNVKGDEPFNLEYIISNKSLKALKGKIKVTWEREFKMKSNSYRPSDKKDNYSNDEEFCDNIGTQNINIPANAKFWKNTVACKFPNKKAAMINNETGNKNYYCAPIVHIYYMAEGTSEWKLLRTDCDWTFNPVLEDNGLCETTNCMRLVPQSWR